MKRKSTVLSIVLVSLIALCIFVFVYRLHGGKPDRPVGLPSEPIETASQEHQAIERRGLSPRRIPTPGGALKGPQIAGQSTNVRAPVEDNALPLAGVALAEKMGNAFAKEAVDSRWSIDAAHKVSQTLKADLPPGSTIGEVHCRSTMCSFEMRHTTEAGMQAFVQNKLGHKDTGLGGGPITIALTKMDSTDTRGMVFLAREGYNLPRVDEEN